MNTLEGLVYFSTFFCSPLLSLASQSSSCLHYATTIQLNSTQIETVLKGRTPLSLNSVYVAGGNETNRSIIVNTQCLLLISIIKYTLLGNIINAHSSPCASSHFFLQQLPRQQKPRPNKGLKFISESPRCYLFNLIASTSRSVSTFPCILCVSSYFAYKFFIVLRIITGNDILHMQYL